MRLTSSVMSKVGELTKLHSNLPEAYIDRYVNKVYYKTPRAPQYLQREIKRKNYRFTMNRPWTAQAQTQNAPNNPRPKVFVEPIKDWSFFKGDRVEVLVGKDKGKQGIVAQVIQERNWVIVEGLNTFLRRVGKTEGFAGIIVVSEKPLLVTNEVQLVDPSDLQGCKIEWRYQETGERVRISCRTGRIIPIPTQNLETPDYKQPQLYKAAAKDTIEDDVKKITFEPELKTFEMDLMEKMGIKEERIPKPVYWY